MAVKLRCSLCRGTFPWDVSKGFPDECELCHQRMAGQDRPDDEIVMPSLRTAKMALTDSVYRDMEKGSEVRAQAAAEKLGVPVSEMSDLKITDLRSTRYPGEIAAPPLPQHLQGVGSFGGSQGSQYSAQVQSGPAPNSGAKTRTALQAYHSNLTKGYAVTDSPALETQQPGYRRRG